MKKNISHKERILKETGLSEEEFYSKFPTEAHYQEYCNGGKIKMKLGGKLKKYDDGGQGLLNYNTDKLTSGVQPTDSDGLTDGLSKAPGLVGQGIAGATALGQFAGGVYEGISPTVDTSTIRYQGSSDPYRKQAINATNKASVTGLFTGAIGLPKMIMDTNSAMKEQKANMVAGMQERNIAMFNTGIDSNYGNSDMPGFALGGQMDKLTNNDLIQYSAKPHSLGGQDINAGGIPVTDNSGKANIEKDENNHNGYIYSATLGLDKLGNPTSNSKEVKTTYSKLAKKINSKYGKKTDTLGERTKEFEYNNLKAKNDESIKMKEEVDIKKANNAMSRYMKKYGGLIQYGPGGDTKPWGEMTPAERFAIQNQYSSYLGVPKEQGDLFGGLKQNLMYPYSGNPGVIPSTNTGTPPQIFANPSTPNTPPYLGALPPQTSNLFGVEQGDPLYDQSQRIGKNWNLQPNPINDIPDVSINPNTNNYNPNTSWWTNNRIQQPVPNPMKRLDSPNSYIDPNTGLPSTELNLKNAVNNTPNPVKPPLFKREDNTDYAGLGLSTIAPLINFAYSTVKDNNKYYPNTKEGLARNELTQLPTEYNIDANLAQNSRDTIAQQKSTNNRTPSVANSINSQLLTNKLYANNQLYGTKANAETQMKGDRLKALANFDYQSGDANRREAIAREDKNLANKARREDLQLNAINTASSNLNTMRNDKIGVKAINEILKYSTWDDKTQTFIPKKGLTPAETYTFNSLLKKK